MRENAGRWIVFGVLVAFLGGILISHSKKQESLKPADNKHSEEKSSVVSEVLEKVESIATETHSIDSEGYYPEETQNLKKSIQDLLAKAKKKNAKGELIALITPHAGMEYSGQIAAEAFKQLKGKKYETVVILLPNHEAVNLNRILICPKGDWATPIGKVEVDRRLADALKKESSEFDFQVDPFKEEHAFDLQLPFLQETIGEFKVLPIMIGGNSSERAMRLADALNRTTENKSVLFLATTHFSRGEVYDTAKRIDFLATTAIEEVNADKLRQYEKENVIEMCGYTPVLSLLYVLNERKVKQGDLLAYANTADVTGKKEGIIVGYASIAFYK